MSQKQEPQHSKAVERARIATAAAPKARAATPATWSHSLGLQRAVGNRAFVSMLAETAPSAAIQQKTLGGGVSGSRESGPGQVTGLPDPLKAGVESLSGVSLEQVRVHYNSSLPETLNARAYTTGSDIHIAPGEERHLPHEAWHVVQQQQGRVDPTMQLFSDVPLNDDAGLEREADVMGQQGAELGARLMAPDSR
jgi:Domain of unknown function (DUF4157)